jgi:hypothetical protein
MILIDACCDIVLPSHSSVYARRIAAIEISSVLSITNYKLRDNFLNKVTRTLSDMQPFVRVISLYDERIEKK